MRKGSTGWFQERSVSLAWAAARVGSREKRRRTKGMERSARIWRRILTSGRGAAAAPEDGRRRAFTYGSRNGVIGVILRTTRASISTAQSVTVGSVSYGSGVGSWISVQNEFTTS